MHSPAPSPHATPATLVPRVAVTGALAMVLVAVLGAAGILWRLGADADATAARVEADVRARVARQAAELTALVRGLADDPAVARALSTRDQPALFDRIEAIARDSARDVAVTVATPDGTAVAWSGRPQAEPGRQPVTSPSLGVAPGTLGLRLVHVAPIVGPGATSVVGSVAAEQLLARASGVDTREAQPTTFDTSLMPVTLTPRFLGPALQTEGARIVTIDGPSGTPLMAVTIPQADVERLRQTWWLRLGAAVADTFALTALILAGVLAWERRWLAPAPYRRATLLAFLALLLARLVLWFAWPPMQAAAGGIGQGLYQGDVLDWLHRTPFDLAVTAFLLLAAVTLSVDPVRRVRLAWRSRRRSATASALHRLAFSATQLAAGAIMAAHVFVLLRLVQDTVSHSEVDVLMLALMPRLEAGRVLVLLGLLALSGALFWGAVLVLRIGLLRWRLPGVGRGRATAWPVALWLAPTAVAVVATRASSEDAAVLAPAALALAACGAAVVSARGLAWFRRGTQARRLLTMYGALLLPALLLYPVLLHTVDQSRRRQVQSQYTPQVLTHSDSLRIRLDAALQQIDAVTGLAGMIEAVPRQPGRVPTDTAFALWRQTDLAAYRLTSAVELYAADGLQLSRFGFNFPEYQTQPPAWRGKFCTWDVFGEVAAFGSEERSMLHAERAVCDGPPGQTTLRGGIIVHVLLDYRPLPFLSTQGPYYDLFRERGGETTPTGPSMTRDIDLVVYGWGRSAIYSSSERVWPLPQRVFDRAVQGREPFWDTQQRGDRLYDIHVSNDRFAIYVVGMPRVAPIGHLVHIAEVATLAALATLVVLLVHAVLHRVNRRGPQPATLLVREVRASFTRKLFLAFVATSVIPVLTLAFVVRTFVAARLRVDVEAEATRTATVARRVIEETLALQDVPAAATSIGDDAMVWIGQVIRQDVNLFDGPTLLATSQRDLFAQGFLPERTPDTVYRAIVLERLPNFVGTDQIGPLEYQLAATPIRIGSREVILTVPMTLRQREIEREIAELDRSVNLGAVIFILLGAALGYSISGRIGDPVQRLTRASRRIAAGDLDQRVVARTADELQRLVEAFNSMAADLSRQREQLQRTNRLEAWAEMARQVAHDIKNPLTPIQLSAEHLRRVHADRGTPLSPVLEQCVDTILVQVRMLRQISSEFASFASSPTARVAPTPLPAIIEEVMAGYRIGLPSNVQVSAMTDGELPDVLVDRALLGRAMINIIENALHAMPSGGTVTVTAAQLDPSWVRVSLADTGVGMDDAALARLYEPYFSTKATGTGLGLSTAKRNLELMGGRILVTSARGVGTTVSLDLPVAGGDPPSTDREADPSRSAR